MELIAPQLKNWNVQAKRVILRADANVPLNDGKVLSDFRLQALKPTLDYLLAHGAQAILLTHIGRPIEGDSAFSTRHLIPWFTAYGYDIQFAPTIADALQSTAQIVLLENLRFWKEESLNSSSRRSSGAMADRSGQAAQIKWAKQLASLGEFYVDDAFGVMHRNDTSVTLLAQEFAPDHRSIGFLVQKEMAALEKIKNNPEQPFVAILGGGKAHDKIPLIEKLIDRAHTILLCPAIAFTFEKARGTRVGKSFVDEESLPTCREIMALCEKKGVKIIFPVDYQVALDTLHGPLSFVAADAFPATAIGISIGPKTIKLFSEIILNAHTLFFNGLFGFLERKETLEGTRKLIELIAQSSGTSIVAGGDTSAVAQAFGLLDALDYVSTGGGATLAYIAGEELPGLSVLCLP